MKVAMMQPTFLPWQGYFELIYQADCFIFLDDFQFSVQSYHQRNRLFVNSDQVDWYTIPVKKSNAFGGSLNNTKFDESRNWRKKLVKRLQQNYSKTPFYNDIYPLISKIIIDQVDDLSTLNIKLIKEIVKLFEWDVEWKLSSSLPSNATRSKRVLELLRWCGASHYYSSGGASEYMKEDNVFPVSDLEVFFQRFHVESYPQRNSSNGFIPSLSVLDALFNVGPAETARLITNNNNHWDVWK